MSNTEIKIFFLIFGSVFSSSKDDKAHQEINFYPLFRSVRDPALHPRIPLELEKIDQVISGLDMQYVNKELSVESKYNKFHTNMLIVAMRDAADFDIPLPYNVDAMHELYALLVENLRKIRTEKFEEEDVAFLNYFLNKAWYIPVKQREGLRSLVKRGRIIIKGMIGDPAENKPENIKQLALGVSKLNKNHFIKFLIDAVLKMHLKQLDKLITNKNDVIWYVVSSTTHKDLLTIFDWIKKIIEGEDIVGSVEKIQELLHNNNQILKKILELLSKRAMSGLIYSEKKDESIKYIKNTSIAQKVCATGQSDLTNTELTDSILNFLTEHFRHRDLPIRMALDLEQQGHKDLAEAIKVKFSPMGEI